MYTREELEKRIFARNKEEWLDAASRDYHSKEEVKADGGNHARKA